MTNTQRAPKMLEVGTFIEPTADRAPSHMAMPLTRCLRCLGLSIAILAFGIMALGTEPARADHPVFTCDKEKQKTLVGYYRFAVTCSGRANNGFSMPWLPDKSRVELSLATPDEGVRVSAYWATASEVEKKLEEIHDATNTLQKQQDEFEEHNRGAVDVGVLTPKSIDRAEDELKKLKRLDPASRDKQHDNRVTYLKKYVRLAKAIKDSHDKISSANESIFERFLPHSISGQSDKVGVRTIKLRTPDVGWDAFYPTKQLLLVGLEEDNQGAKLSFVSLARAEISSGYSVALFGAALAVGGVGLLLFGLFRSRWFAGPSGRLSLASVQIWFFSVVVIIVSAYIFLRTGTLGDISEDVLLLIGIAGIGGSAAKVGDRFTQRLSWQNWLWLREVGWLPPKVEYRFGQLFQDSTGNVDVFRFQAVSFSVLVGGYLLTSGLSGLDTIDLPDAIMGLLGLSQVTYIGGKIAASPKFNEFDAQLTTYLKERADKGPAGDSVHAKGLAVAQAFQAVFGHDAMPYVHPNNAGLVIEFAADTKDLFPVNIDVDGQRRAHLPVYQDRYQDLLLLPAPGVKVEVGRAATLQPGAPNPGPATETEDLLAGKATVILLKQANF